mmetsp:Transcript_16653/g.52449  ORF Transcript_16653/g.52449 Transcript_16653/m.52449 type:complete len:290 (-) Transcript_16653:793-1662(-)
MASLSCTVVLFCTAFRSIVLGSMRSAAPMPVRFASLSAVRRAEIKGFTPTDSWDCFRIMRAAYCSRAWAALAFCRFFSNAAACCAFWRRWICSCSFMPSSSSRAAWARACCCLSSRSASFLDSWARYASAAPEALGFVSMIQASPAMPSARCQPYCCRCSSERRSRCRICSATRCASASRRRSTSSCCLCLFRTSMALSSACFLACMARFMRGFFFTSSSMALLSSSASSILCRAYLFLIASSSSLRRCSSSFLSLASSCSWSLSFFRMRMASPSCVSRSSEAETLYMG